MYISNLSFLISVLSDSMIFCCGDLLPLLSSATSPDFSQDVIQPCGGMQLETAFSFLNRVMSLVDTVVYTSNFSFSGVEANRNLAGGGFLRQCTRLGKSKNVHPIVEDMFSLRDVFTVILDARFLKYVQMCFRGMVLQLGVDFGGYFLLLHVRLFVKFCRLFVFIVRLMKVCPIKHKSQLLLLDCFYILVFCREIGTLFAPLRPRLLGVRTPPHSHPKSMPVYVF